MIRSKRKKKNRRLDPPPKDEVMAFRKLAARLGLCRATLEEHWVGYESLPIRMFGRREDRAATLRQCLSMLIYSIPAAARALGVKGRQISYGIQQGFVDFGRETGRCTGRRLSVGEVLLIKRTLRKTGKLRGSSNGPGKYNAERDEARRRGKSCWDDFFRRYDL